MAETYTAFIDPNFDFSTRQDIGNEIIRYIQERSKNGRGIGNRSFSGPDGDNKYSDNYTRTSDFRNNKSGSIVDLTLTGDMLDAIQILDASIPGRIVVGYEDGFENDKARWMKEKGYEFLGLTDRELSDITSNYDSGAGASFSDVLRSFLGPDDGSAA
jgi:hypothetical protein